MYYYSLFAVSPNYLGVSAYAKREIIFVKRCKYRGKK